MFINFCRFYFAHLSRLKRPYLYKYFHWNMDLEITNMEYLLFTDASDAWDPLWKASFIIVYVLPVFNPWA